MFKCSIQSIIYSIILVLSGFAAVQWIFFDFIRIGMGTKVIMDNFQLHFTVFGRSESARQRNRRWHFRRHPQNEVKKCIVNLLHYGHIENINGGNIVYHFCKTFHKNGLYLFCIWC